MKPARVRLIDLGMQEDFDASATFAQSLVRSLLARDDRSPAAEVELIRSRDFWVVAAAFQAEAHVIHLLSHSDKTADDLGFWGDDGDSGISLPELDDQFSDEGWGSRAGTLLADCCSSAHGRFIESVRHCIEDHLHRHHPLNRLARIHDLRLCLLRRLPQGPRTRPLATQARRHRRRTSHRRLQAIVDGPCPYTIKELRPSRQAKQAFTPGN